LEYLSQALTIIPSLTVSKHRLVQIENKGIQRVNPHC
jgi:hypothetical protein